MKEEKNKLEEKIREKLYNYSREVPEHLWTGISKGIAVKSVIGFSLFGKIGIHALIDLAVVLVSAPIIGKSLLAENRASLDSQKQHTIEATHPSLENDKTILSSKTKSSTVLNTVSKQTSQQSETAGNSNPTNAATKVEKEKNYSSQTANTWTQSEMSAVQISTTTKPNSKKVESKKDLVLAATLISSKSLNGKKGISKHFENTSPQTQLSIAGETKLHPSEENTIPKNAENDILAKVEKGGIETESLKVNQETVVENKAPEEAKTKTGEEANITIPSVVPAVNQALSDSSKTKKVKGNFTIELFVSPDLYFLHNSNNKEATLANRMDSAGIKKKALSGGIRVNYNLTKNFIIKSGLTYSTLATKYAIDKTTNYTEMRVDSTSSHYTLQDPFSLPLILKNYDTSYVNKSKSETLNSSMKFTWLQIPLLLEYRKTFSKISLGLEGGLNFSVLFHKKGNDIAAETLTESALQDATLVAYRKQLSLSWTLGLNCNYSLSKHLYLVLAPHYTSYFKAATLSDYGLNQRWAKFGIRGGLGYLF